MPRSIILLFLSYLLLLDCSAGEQNTKSFGPLWGRVITNGDIGIYKPLGFVGDLKEDGTISIGMADVSISLSVSPMISAVEIDKAHKQIELVSSLSRGASNSRIETITRLGTVKGHGIRWRIDFPSSDLRQEDIVFITDGPTQWCITASCRIFDEGQKRLYEKIVSRVARAKPK